MFWTWWNAQETYRQLIWGGLAAIAAGILLAAGYPAAGVLLSSLGALVLLAGLIGAAVR